MHFTKSEIEKLISSTDNVELKEKLTKSLASMLYTNSDTSVLIPSLPSDSLINSMCLRYNHAFCLPTKAENDEHVLNTALTEKEKSNIRSTMNQLHEEVTLRGFYKPQL